MSLIARLVLWLALPITALIVARDSLQFGLIQTFVAVILVAMTVGMLAAGPRLWQWLRRSPPRQN